MENSALPMLLITLITNITQQLISDCTYEEQILMEGESKTVGNCEQVTCVRRSIDRKVCDSIPFGCTPMENESQLTNNYPDCCPRWCCGKECNQRQSAGRPANTIPDLVTSSKLPLHFHIGDASASKTTPPFMQSSNEEYANNEADLLPIISPGESAVSTDADGDACMEGGRRIQSGQSASAPGCRRMDCKDGILTTHFCQEVPSGCRVVREHKDGDFPDCCPFWNCDYGESGPSLTARSLGRSCNFEGRSIRNGQTDYTDDCGRMQCTNGILTTHFCRNVPSGCRIVHEHKGRDFPGCCPFWNCDHGGLDLH